MEPTHVLVIEDKHDIGKLIGDTLCRDGARVSLCRNGADGLSLLERQPVHVLMVDLDVAEMDEAFLRRAASIQPRLSVAAMVNSASLESARRQIQVPRVDYLTKPLAIEAIRSTLARAIGRQPGRAQPREAGTPPLPQRVDRSAPAKPAAPAIVARSGAMCEILKQLPRIASSEAAVLIQGEPGVGKALLAREIHRQSRRAAGPFVRVACGAIRESELDATLFGPGGTEYGASGRRSAGLLERAHGGTLFLDGVAQLPLWAQIKLRDVLQQAGQDHRQNGETAPLDVRVIASAPGDLEGCTSRNAFDSSLYYYLNVVRVYVPPLRHRQQDIRALAEQFLAAWPGTGDAPGSAVARRFSEGAWQCLLHYDWPGNTLQLASVVTRAAMTADGEEIGESCVAESLGKVHHQDCDTIAVPLAGGLKEMERSIVEEVIHRCRGNKAAAARTLGLHRRTLYRMLDEDASSKPGRSPLPLAIDLPLPGNPSPEPVA